MLLIVALVLALLGIAVSVRLTVVYHQANSSFSHKSACAINAQWDCDHVARSGYAKIFGAPTSLWALLGYALMAIFAGWGAFRREDRHWPLGVLALLVLGALGMSTYLAWAAVVVLKKKCLWCTTLYGINLLLGGTLVGAFIRRGVGPVAAVRKDLGWLLDHQGALGWLAGGVVLACTVILALGPQLGRPGAASGSRRSTVELITHPSQTAGSPGRKAPPGPPAWVRKMVTPTTPFRGPVGADLYIVEFSDYECPFCQRSNRVMEKILKKYGKRIRLYHRHFPLDMTCYKRMKRQLHHSACFAARAAYCAHRQSKFWTFHDALFRLGSKISKDAIMRLAESQGLDMARLGRCVRSARARKKVAEDLAAGEALKVEGTPTFFMGGPMIKRFSPEGISVELFDRLFSLLDKAKGSAATRKPGMSLGRAAPSPGRAAPSPGRAAPSPGRAAPRGAPPPMSAPASPRRPGPG